MFVDPTAEQIREAIRAEDEQLARVVAFIREGMRNGRIGDESGETLVDAAEQQHAAAVRPLQLQLPDPDAGPRPVPEAGVRARYAEEHKAQRERLYGDTAE